MKYTVKIKFENGFIQKFVLPFYPNAVCFDALIASSVDYCMCSVVYAEVKCGSELLVCQIF